LGKLDFDVAIAGAGPAGATAALVLARNGIKVGLIEASAYEQSRVGESLPPSARPLLAELSIWESFSRLDSLQSHGNESAWGGADTVFNSFIFNPHGYGWHLDRCQFDALLASEAKAAGATLLQRQKVVSCIPLLNDSWKLVVCDNNREHILTARAVIDASGRNGLLARQLGAIRKPSDFLVGIAVHFRSEKSGGNYTLVEATEHGWWYSATLPDHRLIIIFMTDSDICRKGYYMKLEVWEKNLEKTQHTKTRIIGCSRLWGPSIFPAFSHRLRRQNWSNRWLACGDAAMGVDPLSSSGIMSALKGGEAAGYTILHWLNGDSQSILLYEQWIDEEFADYMKKHQAYYCLEKRWPNSPFWLRRNSKSSQVSYFSMSSKPNWYD